MQSCRILDLRSMLTRYWWVKINGNGAYLFLQISILSVGKDTLSQQNPWNETLTANKKQTIGSDNLSVLHLRDSTQSDIIYTLSVLSILPIWVNWSHATKMFLTYPFSISMWNPPTFVIHTHSFLPKHTFYFTRELTTVNQSMHGIGHDWSCIR